MRNIYRKCFAGLNFLLQHLSSRWAASGKARRSDHSAAKEERNVDEVLDRAALLAVVDGDLVLLRELIEMFTPEYQRRLAQLQKAIAEKDAAGLRVSAHAIKSLVGNFCARRPYDAADELEQMGRRGDLDIVKEVSDRLESETQAMKMALDRLIQEESR